MVPSLQDLLARIDLSLTPAQCRQLERLAAELLHWNRRRNLTAITAPDEITEKHLLDSLTLKPWAAQARRLLDIGSGAGFPALPLKIACPELAVVSVDAVGKKIAFQRHVARLLGLTGFEAVHDRAEQLAGRPDCAAGFDLVTARALTALPDLVRLASPFLAPGGRLVAMKGAEGPGELAACREALVAEGWTATLQAFRLPLSGAERTLLILQR